MTHRIRSLSAVLAGALALSACGDEAASRTDAVDALTTDAVPARYEALAESAVELDDAVSGWCDTGDSASLLDRVDATRRAWSAVLPFWFGPVMDRRSRFIVDPTVSTDDIVELLDSGEPIDADALRDLYGTDQRGLAAVEELVELAEGETPTPRQCEYAGAATQLVADESAALASEWVTVGPEFAESDESANSAIEAMVNEILFAIVGLANDPDVEVATAKLDAMRWTLLGDPTTTVGNTDGIGVLLDSEIVEQLTTEFDAAADLDADALDALEVTITTNVVSALGLSVQFSDADGDG